MWSAIFLVASRLHLITTAIHAVGRVVVMLSHSNFGLIGLDRLFTHFGF
jgi:hypothetical protein